MATGDYNSPYTGQQLDDTIRKISSNSIHTYVKVFDNAAGAPLVSINSLPAGPNGLRTGVYDINYSYNASTRNSSRVDVFDLSQKSFGATKANALIDGTDVTITSNQPLFESSTQEFRVGSEIVNIGQNTLTQITGPLIYEIYRQDTIA